MLRSKWTLLFLVFGTMPSMAFAQFPSPKSIGAFNGVRRGLESVVRAASQSNSSRGSSPLVDAQTAKSVSAMRG
jgi:hypothetical protein